MTTRKEWMTQNRPVLVGDEFIGGVYGCPGEFIPECPTWKICGGLISDDLQSKDWDKRCSDCWNKEMVDQ